MTVKQIIAPVSSEMKEFEVRFRENMQSHVPMLDKVTHYIIRRKGKQMRPMFLFLTAKMLGEINDKTYQAASLVELLHTATLVHDDVVDDANERRGFFSVNALWKNKVAVLVGDYMLSKVLLLSIENNNTRLLGIVARAVKEMSEGELLQIEKARKLDITEEVYFEVIRQKTASLIAAACCAGAVSTAPDDDEIKKRMWLFGEKTGMAFQIRDDLFDFGDDDVGKPLGIDIKEKKMTLPLIYALNQAEKSVRRYMINIVKNESHKPEKVDEVIRFVRQSGGLDYAREAMYRYRQEAFDLLELAPESPARQSLRDLLVFVTERKR